MTKTVALVALGAAAALLLLPAVAVAQDSTTIGVRESGCSGARGLCFDKDTLALEGGQALTITLNNNGAIPHSICFRLTGGEACTPNAGTGGTNAGGTGTVQVTGPAQGGVVHYYCKEPGHEAAGMAGNATFTPRMPGNDSTTPPPPPDQQPRPSPTVGVVAILAGVALLGLAIRRK